MSSLSKTKNAKIYNRITNYSLIDEINEYCSGQFSEKVRYTIYCDISMKIFNPTILLRNLCYGKVSFKINEFNKY